MGEQESDDDAQLQPPQKTPKLCGNGRVQTADGGTPENVLMSGTGLKQRQPPGCLASAI